jgi:RNA polymerase sigma-70 factor (ECF subfamily)
MTAQPLQETGQSLTDQVLAGRVAAGDKHALKALVRKYNQRLYRTARAILGDESEAEDVVQDAYLIAYRAIGGFRGEAKLSTWLIRIVANEAIARYRKRTRRAAVIPLGGEGAEAAAALAEAPDFEQPEQQAMRAESRRILEKRIDELPDDYRTVVMLRAVEELNVEETAAVLGIPEATVRSRFFRARSLLREAVSRDFDMAMEEVFAFAGSRCDRMLDRVLAAIGEDDSPGARASGPHPPKETP